MKGENQLPTVSFGLHTHQQINVIRIFYCGGWGTYSSVGELLPGIPPSVRAGVWLHTATDSVPSTPRGKLDFTVMLALPLWVEKGLRKN